MESIFCFVLMEMLVLLHFVVVVDSSSSCSSTVLAFITRTANRCKHQHKQEIYYKSESSTDNLDYLQNRFNLTERWMKRQSSINLSTLNHSIILSRIDWLKERLDLNEDQVGRVIQMAPQNLSCRPDNNLGPTLDVMTDLIMLKPKELSNLILKSPSILNTPAGKIQEKLNWIEMRLFPTNSDEQSRKSTLQKKKIIKSWISKYPILFKRDFDNNFDPKWKMLQERLDLNETQMAKNFIQAPTWLNHNFTTSIGPRLDWLQENLNLDAIELSKIIQKQPTLLHISVKENLQPKLLWLKKRLFLDDSTIKKIVIKFPGLLIYSTTTKIEPTFQWIEERFALDDSFQISIFIKKCPHILSMGIENNLQPTFEFFQDCIGEENAVKLLGNNPAYLTVSLEKRLKPRYEQAKQAGIDVDVGCLQRIVLCTDERWIRSIDYQRSRVSIN